MPYVRGVMLLNAVAFVRDAYGSGAHDRVIASLPARHCGRLLGTLRDASWEPAEDLVAYMEAARALLAPDEPTFFRRLGRFAGERERNAQGYRPMVADPSTAMRLAPVIWSSFYDEGRLEVVVSGPREATTHIHGFRVSRVLCERTCGSWEGLASTETLEARVSEVACAVEGAPACEMRVVWVPAGSPPLMPGGTGGP